MFNFFKKKAEKKPLNIRIRDINKRRSLVAQQRKFDAGFIDNLTYSFTGSQASINEEIRHGLRLMRARSRDLCFNNDYAKRFIKMVQSNVVGPEGIKLQGRIKQDDGITSDDLDNKVLERAWRQWGKPENCSVERKLSFNDIERLVIGCVARDGEVLIHLVETPFEGFGLRLGIYSGDYLDEVHNEELPNGNIIIMGVEYDPNGVIVNYHLRKGKIKSYRNVYPERDYRVIPAEQIIHLHIVDFPDQARGVPWTHTAIRRLNMMGKYEEAELVAAAIGASKMGFYSSLDGDGPTPDEIAGDNYPDDDAELIQKMEPGYIENLPQGTSFTGFDPTHPTTAFDGFMRAILRGASAGLNVAYSGISNDLENVNFSSIRSGVLEERDQWKLIQRWLITHMHQRIYEKWLGYAILRNRLPFAIYKIDEKMLFENIQWQPRGWDWVDPKKDSDANMQNVKLGVETRQSILSKQGRDFDETLQQLAYEKQAAEKAGVNIEDFDNSRLSEVTINADE